MRKGRETNADKVMISHRPAASLERCSKEKLKFCLLCHFVAFSNTLLLLTEKILWDIDAEIIVVIQWSVEREVFNDLDAICGGKNMTGESEVDKNMPGKFQVAKKMARDQCRDQYGQIHWSAGRQLFTLVHLATLKVAGFPSQKHVLFCSHHEPWC